MNKEWSKEFWDNEIICDQGLISIMKKTYIFKIWGGLKRFFERKRSQIEKLSARPYFQEMVYIWVTITNALMQ